MRFGIFLNALACVPSTSALINWALKAAENLSDDQIDAYNTIAVAMNAACDRYNRVSGQRLTKNLLVSYAPGEVPTAQANYAGEVRFGADRIYMNERVALHEISHTMGIGQTMAFDENCYYNDWPTATPLLQSWDGPGARIICGDGHIQITYGLNSVDDWSEVNADRHVQLIKAMIDDGMQKEYYVYY